MSGGIRPACVAVVGRHNNPLYIQAFGVVEDELRFHFIVHTSLDVVEERAATKEKQGALDSYLGLLYPTEDFNVYGYVTASAVKLVLVLDDAGLDTGKIRSFFRDFHALYCDTVSNPFYELGTPITSPAFKTKLAQLLAAQ